MIRRLIPILLFCCIASFTVAQFPYTSKMASPDPLPTPVIYDLFNDKLGYLWLATDKGLIKFNSRTFATLPFQSTQSKSVGYINQDPQGTIWCMNFYKQIFYVQNDSLKLFTVADSLYQQHIGLLNMSVNDKSIFISSIALVVEIDKRTHKIINQISKNIDNAGFQHSILYNNALVYSTRKNYLSNLNNNRIKLDSSLNFFELRFATDSKNLLAIERGKRSRLALRYNGQTVTKLPNFNMPKEAYVYHLVSTGNNEFWICTQFGAYLWNYETGATQLLLPNERVSDVVKDFQGNYWFSTLDNGLYKCPNINCIKIASPFVSNNSNTTKILKLKNGHYILGNTKGELVDVDNQFKKNRAFTTSTKEEIEFLFADEKEENIYCDAGLFNYTFKEKITSLDFGKCVAKDAFGNIISATFGKCFITTNTFKNTDSNSIPNNCTLYKSLSNSFIKTQEKLTKKVKLLRERRTNWVTTNSNNQGFWVAYDDNLYYYQYNGATNIIYYSKKPIIATHLNLFKNKLYISTTTNGLLVFDIESKTINQFATQNGLQSNSTRKTIINENKIWLLTDESLDVIDIETNLVQDFFSSSGLESLTVYDFTVDSNKVILATPNGIMFYNQTQNSLGERIKITQLKLTHNNQEILPNALLPYHQNAVSIKFDAIHYKAPSKLFFHYRLIGSNNSWNTVIASNNILNYDFLPPGNYTFEVFAADANMIFRSATTSFSFAIANPFWQTWWFVTLSIISILVIGYYLLKWWTNRFKQSQKAKENLLQSKLTAIRSQMNPHFLYNVLNTVQGLVYANKKSEATEMLGNFSDLMRKTLEESNKTEIALKDEIQSLQLYLALEEKRFEQQVEFNIVIDENIDVKGIHLPSMFIQPFAENAIKHGLLHKEGLKKLSITITQKQSRLLVFIDDNGIGRKQSAIINQINTIKSTGFAIKGIEDRIAIYNAMNKEKIDWQIIDKEQGTLVELSLPIK